MTFLRPFFTFRQIRADCKASAEKLGLPYRELSFTGAVRLMVMGLWNTGQTELALRSDRRKYTKTQAYMRVVSAVVDTLKAD